MDPSPSNSAIRDTRDYIRALFYSYYTAITGWGVLLMHGVKADGIVDQSGFYITVS